MSALDLALKVMALALGVVAFALRVVALLTSLYFKMPQSSVTRVHTYIHRDVTALMTTRHAHFA